jgi:hypothetical protein
MQRRATSNEQSALDRVRQQFEYWRSTREKRCPIPGNLWGAAQSLYPEYSLYHISKALRLNYTDLKGRIELKGSPSLPSTTNPAEFIELGINPAMATSECFVEMEDSFGAKMSMQYKGGAGPDLLELCRLFWGRRS